MRVVFMGSPAFAVPCLRALVEAHEVVLVVSQPDKPAGRGGQLAAPAVKLAAQELALPVIQPKSARTGELADALAASGAEVAIVVAYGKILPPAVLTALPRGCLNVHGSILPRYRGAAPVQWAVIHGDAETGVSIMQLDEGMDTGPVYLERRVAIGAEETSGELLERLAPIGAAALLSALADITSGTAHAKPQDPASEVAARIRGVDPWPGAYALLKGQPLKLFHAIATPAHPAPPGTVWSIGTHGVAIATGDGMVTVRELQAAGRKRMTAAQFAAGRGIAAGDVLARPEPA
jgi:methionyl-tRNA formyltransferase